MARIIFALLSGLAVGLAFGLSAGSSMLGSTDSQEKAKEKALYRGQPASFWIGQLGDRDPSFRREAMWALAHLAPGDESSVRALADMLKHKNEGVRSGAAVNLGRMGPAAFSCWSTSSHAPISSSSRISTRPRFSGWRYSTSSRTTPIVRQATCCATNGYSHRRLHRRNVSFAHSLPYLSMAALFF